MKTIRLPPRRERARAWPAHVMTAKRANGRTDEIAALRAGIEPGMTLFD